MASAPIYPASPKTVYKISKIWQLYRETLPKALLTLSQSWNRIPPDDQDAWCRLFSSPSRSQWKSTYGKYLEQYVLAGTPLAWKTVLDDIAVLLYGNPLNWEQFRMLLEPIENSDPARLFEFRQSASRYSQRYWYGIPCWDLPERIVGWWLLAFDNGHPLQYYLKLSDDAPPGASWQGIDRDSQCNVILTDNLILYLIWTAGYYCQTGRTNLPLAACAFERIPVTLSDQPCLICSEYLRGMHIKWSLSLSRSFWHAPMPLLPGRQATQKMAALTTHILSDSRHAYFSAWKQGEAWNIHLSRRMLTESASSVQLFFASSQLSARDLSILKTRLEHPSQNVLDRIVEDESQRTNVEILFEGKTIRRTSQGWELVQSKRSYLVCDTIFQIERVFHNPRTRVTRYSGRVIHCPSGKSVVFEEDHREIEYRARHWLRKLALDHGWPLPQIDRRFAGRLADIARSFSPPSTCLEASRVGWSREDQALILPTGSYYACGKIDVVDPLPSTLLAFPGKLPIVADSSRISRFELAKCTGKTAGSRVVLWAFLAALLRQIVSRFNQQYVSFGCYTMDASLVPALRKAAELLDCFVLSKLPSQTSALEHLIRSHHWPIVGLESKDRVFYEWVQSSAQWQGVWLAAEKQSLLLDAFYWERISADKYVQPDDFRDVSTSTLQQFLSYYLYLQVTNQLLHPAPDSGSAEILESMAQVLKELGCPADAVIKAQECFVEESGFAPSWMELIKSLKVRYLTRTTGTQKRIVVPKQQLLHRLREYWPCPEITSGTLRYLWSRTGWKISENQHVWIVSIPLSDSVNPAIRMRS